MIKQKFFAVAFSLSIIAGLMQCHSQPATLTPIRFEGTSPCDENVRTILGIPSGAKCEMIRWDLALLGDAQEPNSATFKLICEYGMPKQGTKGFETGSSKIELNGKYAVAKATPGTNGATVYNLYSNDPKVSLSFLQPDQNLLHLLNPDKTLANGNGAWSYTLNRVDPVQTAAKSFALKEINEAVTTGGLDTVGVFDGRTPCDNRLRQINNISATGCQVVKCRLILLADEKTKGPGNFILHTIYVGNGDNNRYTTTGRWKFFKGGLEDPLAIVYKLEPQGERPQQSLLLVKAGDTILFFIDNNTRFMVGNNYASYTLNRKN